MKISDLSIRRPVFAGVLSALLVIAGAIGYTSLPVRELPDIDSPRVSVVVGYPGANSAVVENRLTRVIEDELSGIAGIEEITSQSEDAEARISLTFDLDRDIDAAASDVRAAVSRALPRLPEEVDPPQVRKRQTDSEPILWFALTAPELSIEELTDYAERYLVDRFATLDGVAQVEIGGGRPWAMRVWLKPAELAARGLTVADVEGALLRENVELPGGAIQSAEVDLTVRVLRDYPSAADFARLPIGEAEGAGGDAYAVRLGDVADVERAAAEPRAFFRGNGTPQVGIGIVRQSQANDVEVSAAARAEADRARGGLPDGMELVVSSDATVFVAESIRGVYSTLAITALIVVVTIWLFLGSLRAVLIPAMVVPVCVIATFAVLAVAGFSINILTLLALVLVIGLVVDDSIVVLENVQRRIDGGEPRTLAAMLGTREVFFAVIATTATLVAVFAPLTFLPGTIGRLFVELSVTVVSAVVISSFVALTLSPMMASKLLRPSDASTGVARWTARAIDASRDAYRDALEALLRRGWLVWPLMALTIGAAAFFFVRVPGELVPAEDRGTFRAYFAGPESAGYDYTRAQAKEIEGVLADYVERGELERATVRVPGYNGYASGLVSGSLTPWGERGRDGQTIVEEIDARLAELPGMEARASMRGSIGGGGGNDIEFVLQGGDYAELDEAARRLIADAEDGAPGLSRLEKDYRPTAPRLVVDIDRERAADLGVSVADIGRTLESHLGGRRAGYFIDRGESYDVILQNRPDQRASVNDLEFLYVRGGGGELVPLAGLVSLTETGAAFELNRVNRLRAVTVEASLEPGYALGDAVAWFERWTDEELPAGMSSEFLGGADEFLEANRAALIAFALALLIVYLTLAAQFESLIQPVVIMLSVPLAVCGGLFGLYLTGSSLNIYSQIGLIVLIGLATKNGILIVEFANVLRERGADVREATIEAAVTRFRPILMTGLSTALGALPLALATGPGAESRRTIGIVLFAGLMLATLLTLFVVPVVHAMLGRWTSVPNAVSRRLEREEASRPDPSGEEPESATI